MKKGILITFIIIIFVITGILGLHYFENYEAVCYTKIDNKKITKLNTSNDLKYEYSLTCYKENGNKKNIKFKTSRELKENAYLLLEIRSLGVHSWKEVEFDELPNKVKDKYN